jgi:hypothetical protein
MIIAVNSRLMVAFAMMDDSYAQGCNVPSDNVPLTYPILALRYARVLIFASGPTRNGRNPADGRL